MIIAVSSLAVIGAALGTVLGAAARYLHVEEDPLELELAAILPGSQCGQCGYVGCTPAAQALAKGEAKPTLCIPGGKAVAEALAKRLGVPLDMEDHVEKEPEYALINEELCVGCARCLPECSVDAIVGATKQMHTILTDLCHGCAKCSQVCPTEAIQMVPFAPTVASWHWHNPASGHLN
ncbi:MAG: RnfABCDGE type electron transport complex subunit B [Alphaproteobacteria bacterium]|nr:RnfABCDGE type electron transport complex subunit B [Alphaproteobacteria bacterium]MBF0128630.1 RnfABCDGE type electron transport complex subunit B [Alphaproteobacteria bacterium]